LKSIFLSGLTLGVLSLVTAKRCCTFYTWSADQFQLTKG